MCMFAHMHSVSCESEVQSIILTDVIISIITIIANIYLAFTMCQLRRTFYVFPYVIPTITLYYLSHIIIPNVVTIISPIIQARETMPR